MPLNKETKLSIFLSIYKWWNQIIIIIIIIIIITLGHWPNELSVCNGPEVQGSIPGQVIPKSQKMVGESSWCNG